MSSRVERDFRPIGIVDGLDLFQEELKKPPRETEPDADDADINQPVAKAAGGRDRQKKKKT